MEALYNAVVSALNTTVNGIQVLLILGLVAGGVLVLYLLWMLIHIVIGNRE